MTKVLLRLDTPLEIGLEHECKQSSKTALAFSSEKGS